MILSHNIQTVSSKDSNKNKIKYAKNDNIAIGGINVNNINQCIATFKFNT